MTYVFHKANDPFADNAGLTAYEKKLLQTYIDGLKKLNIATNDPAVMARIMEQVRAGNPLSAANLVPWETFTQSLDETVSLVAAQMATSASLAVTQLPKYIDFKMKFDLTDPRAIAYAQVRSGASIRQINEYSRQAVAKIIQDGLRSNLSMEMVQTQIQKVVGLDGRQATALSKFYESTIEEGRKKGLSYQDAVAKAEKLGNQYRDRLWKQRAARIARTEIATAANEGRALAWQEADQAGLIPDGTKKRWITALDERTCPECSELNNQEVDWQGVFSTGNEMPPAHVNCRCSAVILPGEPSAKPRSETTEYGGYKLREPENPKSTSRGSVDRAATELRDKAVAVEPKITKDMIDLAKKHDGTMVGLEHRIKSQSSLSEKIGTRAGKSSLVDASDQIHDSVRYTMKFKDSDYIAGVTRTVDDLRAKGYTVTTRNNWARGNPYYGVNAQVVTPDGVKMEMQFHTSSSLALKAKTHPIYEELRVSSDPVIQTALHKDMIALTEKVRFPTGDVELLGTPIQAEVGKSLVLIGFRK
jgi:SPP1 gp7 family putative phage head morphogenesis protein